MGMEKRLETSLGGYTCFGVQVRLRVPRFGVCACLGNRLGLLPLSRIVGDRVTIN